MNMRKTILFLILVVMALTLMGGLALAGGWTDITYAPGTGNATNADQWNPTGGDGHPHGNFQTTSNKCRVCHAVHNADGSTWRLLAGATGPDDACDACHFDVAAFTNLRPYDNTVSSFTTRGEHTLNVTVVPDATNTAISALVCNSCHSVHGAGTLLNSAYADTNWDGKILRKDPNRDGVELAKNATGAATDVAGGLTDSPDAVKSGFCADCHTKNPNWNLGGDSNETGGRLNGTSHVQGPDANGSLSVNSVNTTVANFGTTTLTAPNGQAATSGCTACHSATNTGNRTTTDGSAFPHRSKGSKLLFDTYTDGEAGGAALPDRALARMDRVCGGCHDQDGTFATQGDNGVGRTF